MTKSLINQIVDGETGEILSEEVIKVEGKGIKLNRKMIDTMLSKASNVSELDSSLLYSWCRIIGEINSRGQIKILGSQRDEGIEKKLIEDITITGYTMRIIDKAHKFSGFLMSNRKTFIKSWNELYSDIGCKSPKTQSKLKKFLTENKILRDFKIGGDKGEMVTRLILNPFLLRKASYSSQVSIIVYQDFIKEGINMKTYPIRWLQSMGYIK